MAEIFVVNLSAALDGSYVSDLPVVNATPVARQIGYYLPSLVTAYETELADYIEQSGATSGGVAIGSAEAATCAATIASNAQSGFALTTAATNTTCGAATGTVIALDAGTGTVLDRLRILVGADSSSGVIAESANLGNHRIMGSTTRRLYLRDRVDASINEGYLRAQLDAGSIVIYNNDGSVYS